jgi:uncharacterized protein (DUF2141 family)
VALVLGAVAASLLFAAPALALWLKPGIASGNGVVPTVRAGFAGCAAGLTTYTWNGKKPGTQVTPDGISLTVSLSGQSLPGEDKYYFDFTATGGAISQVVVLTEVFIVGFITESNLYDYPTPVVSDKKLHPPANSSNHPYKIDGIRFCYKPTVDISGTVYHDLNANGNRDSGEPGLAGWNVTASGVATPALTDANGAYSFVDLPAGSYQICQQQPSGQGWIQSEPSATCYTGVSGNTSDKDFGNYKNGSISGKVLEDADGDGDISEDTVGLTGFTIEANGTSTDSGAGGIYIISALKPGVYDVCQEEELGWMQSFPVGCHEVTLTSGEVEVSKDFGNFRPATISGTRTLNDEPFPGQTVRLLGGPQPITDITDDDGFYEFTGLAPGMYTVCAEDLGATTPDDSDLCGEGETGTDVTVGSGGTQPVDFSDQVTGGEVAVCGIPEALGGEGVSGTVLFDDCEGAKAILFETDPAPDTVINEVSFDTINEWNGGGFSLEHWIFDPVELADPADWRLYYDDGLGERVALLCDVVVETPSSERPPDPDDYAIPEGETTCIIEATYGLIGSGLRVEVWLLSIGDPKRGFK